MPLGMTKNESVMDDLETSKDPSRFTQLNQKAEEMKKVNLFYLKDILIKLNATHEEKMDCL